MVIDSYFEMNASVIVYSQKGETRMYATKAEIARMYGDLIENRSIQNGGAKFFFKSTYENRGKRYPMYLMNRDGFALLVMGFTGKDALEWKLKYIKAFN